MKISPPASMLNNTTEISPPTAAGGGGGITQITSVDGTVTIVAPTGPVVDLSVQTSGGVAPVLQGSWGFKRIRQWLFGYYQGASAVALDMTNFTAYGNGQGLINGVPVAGSYFHNYSTPALNIIAANANIGYYNDFGAGSPFTRGSATNCGGFLVMFEFGIELMPATLSSGFGMFSNTAEIAYNASPSSFTECLFIGSDTTDTNWQFMHNDSSGTCTKVDTGFAITALDVITAQFYCDPFASTVSAYVRRITDAGAVSTFTATLSSNLPTNTVFICPHFFGGNSVNVNWKYRPIRFYAETPGY